jgi:hypothetical protein
MVFYFPFNVEEREKILDFNSVFVGALTEARYVQKESIPVIDPVTGEVKHRTIGMSVDGEKREFPLTASLLPAFFLKTAWNKLVDFGGYVFGTEPKNLENYKMHFVIGFKTSQQAMEEGYAGRTLPIGEGPVGPMPNIKKYKSYLGGKLLYIDDSLEGEKSSYTGFWKQGKVGKYLRGLEKSLYRQDSPDYM